MAGPEEEAPPEAAAPWVLLDAEDPAAVLSGLGVLDFFLNSPLIVLSVLLRLLLMLLLTSLLAWLLASCWAT